MRGSTQAIESDEALVRNVGAMIGLMRAHYGDTAPLYLYLHPDLAPLVADLPMLRGVEIVPEPRMEWVLNCTPTRLSGEDLAAYIETWVKKSEGRRV